MPSFLETFPHLQHPKPMPDYPRPSTAQEAQTFKRQKHYRIVLNSADREAGSSLTDAFYNIAVAPWLLEDNMDLGGRHWNLKLEAFTFVATKGTAAAPLSLEVHLDGWPMQAESYHTSLQSVSDVVGVVTGTDTAIALNCGNSVGEISLASRPHTHRVRVYLTQLGQPAGTRGVPALAAVTNPWYHMVLALVPSET